LSGTDSSSGSPGLQRMQVRAVPATSHFSRLANWQSILGVAILAALWASPLPAMSGRAFSPHMILHIGVSAVGAPLVAIGLVRAGIRPGDGGGAWLLALSASLFEMIAVWGWHIPLPHEAAARNELAFIAEQASFLAGGMAVWMVSFSGRSRVGTGIGALILLMTFVHMAMLGVLFTLAPILIYAPDVCGGAFGLDALADQRLGGALMAVGGSMSYLIGGTWLMYRFLAGDSPAAGADSFSSKSRASP